MGESIIQSDSSHCYLCGRNGSTDRLEKHHIFGAANRDKSEKYGLTVFICGENCHRNGRKSVHRNVEVSNKLKALAQQKAMEHYGWTTKQFIEIFGKNYLGVD